MGSSTEHVATCRHNAAYIHLTTPFSVRFRIMRRVGNTAIVVPDEGPPLDRDGTPRWPPGWGPGRMVETEADIFELLGLPYRPPHERNAP